ncbi:MAG: hypothetical protein QOH35_2686 [Acidobacteriaceae bacterium]|jgi:hypothetical protein|nr:hypothetical protein [Acidobacteriaceae bacterium]
MNRPKGMKWALRAAALFVVLPLDFFLGIGALFTAPKNVGITGYFFVAFACVLDIPAVLLLFVRERLGALVLLANAVISLMIAAGFFLTYAGLPPVKLWIQIATFWTPKILVGGCMLLLTRQHVRTAT